MFVTLLSLVTAAVGVGYTSSFDSLSKPYDIVHNLADKHNISLSAWIPQALTLLSLFNLPIFARNIKKRVAALQTVKDVIQKVYAPSMLIKGIAGLLTVLPDADPNCAGPYDMLTCFTRNDMLPSGHMILACSVAASANWNLVSKLSAAAVGLSLILAKTHYSADVLLAVVLVKLLDERRRLNSTGAFSASSSGANATFSAAKPSCYSRASAPGSESSQWVLPM